MSADTKAIIVGAIAGFVGAGLTIAWEIRRAKRHLDERPARAYPRPLDASDTEEA